MIDAGGEAWGSLDIVQVRAKSMSTADFEKLTERWTEVASRSAVTIVIVNDRVDIALAVGADGVHVGQGDVPSADIRGLAPPGFVIGVSAHDAEELVRAPASGADYAGLGAFYASPTKPDASRLASERPGLLRAVREAHIPVLAIGGITADRVAEVIDRVPVTGIAASHAIQGAPDPGTAILELRTELDRAGTKRQTSERMG